MIKTLRLVCKDKLDQFFNFSIDNHDKDYEELNTRMIYNITSNETRILLRKLEPRLAHFLLLLQNHELADTDTLCDLDQDSSLDQSQTTLNDEAFPTNTFIFKPIIKTELEEGIEFIFQPSLESHESNPKEDRVIGQPISKFTNNLNQALVNWLEISDNSLGMLEKSKIETTNKDDIFTPKGFNSADEIFRSRQMLPQCNVIDECTLISSVLYMFQGVESFEFSIKDDIFQANECRAHTLGKASCKSVCNQFVKIANQLLELRSFASYFM